MGLYYTPTYKIALEIRNGIARINTKYVDERRNVGVGEEIVNNGSVEIYFTALGV